MGDVCNARGVPDVRSREEDGEDRCRRLYPAMVKDAEYSDKRIMLGIRIGGSPRCNPSSEGLVLENQVY